MERFLEDVIQRSRGLQRPEHEACAIEKYTQMSPSELNAYTGKFVKEGAEYFKFYPEEHSDWVHSGSLRDESDGIRLLDVFFLKYPVMVVPEACELECEYFWYHSNMPEMLFGAKNFDEYMERIAKMIFHSIDAYIVGLESWALLERPTELGDCLKNTSKKKLKQYEVVQLARMRAKEKSCARHYNEGAPPHVLERIKAEAYREEMSLRLIQDSISLV